jgi:hypothetical protein
MDDLQRLVAIDEIKRLKATYLHAMDTKDWPRLQSVFTEDAVFDIRGEFDHQGNRVFNVRMDEMEPARTAAAHGDPSVVMGGAAIVGFIRSVAEKWVTVHHGHAPIIDIVGPDEATAIWPLFDNLYDGNNIFSGYGNYHDKYQRVDGKWLISHLEIRRLRVEGDAPVAGVGPAQS